VTHDHIRLHDLLSKNGTWLNGERVTDDATVKPGDQIRFGELELRLITERPAIPSKDASMATLWPTEEITTMDSITWDRIHVEYAVSAVSESDLLQAVTRAAQLLVLSHPSGKSYTQLLELVSRVIPARRFLLLEVHDPDDDVIVQAEYPPTEATSGPVLLSRTILKAVLEERRVLLLNEPKRDPRFQDHQSIVRLDIYSAIVAPLFDNEKVVGVLYADSNDPKTSYSRNQIGVFTLLANLIAVKITNLRLMEGQHERERMQQEISLASRVQRSLLSVEAPSVKEYELLTRQIPCYEVAGDLYDLTRLDDGRLVIAIGDVTGKGVAAALMMSNVIASLRAFYERFDDPVELMDRLHEQVFRCSDEMHYVTLFVGHLDPKSHRLEYVNAGHCPPLLVCADQGWRRLESTGLPVGLLPDSPYESRVVELPERCFLCAYSDGIVDAVSGGEFFEEDRLCRCLLKHTGEPLREIAKGVIGDLNEFLGDEALDDDVTLLLLRRHS
jgi:serine phosphatase RsbU (regulator of sigma subunit)